MLREEKGGGDERDGWMGRVGKGRVSQSVVGMREQGRIKKDKE